MRSKQLARRYSDEAEIMAYAFDLGAPVYFGSQYIAVSGLDIGAMREDEALHALINYRGTIHRCKTAKEAIRLVEKWNASYEH